MRVLRVIDPAQRGRARGYRMDGLLTAGVGLAAAGHSERFRDPRGHIAAWRTRMTRQVLRRFVQEFASENVYSQRTDKSKLSQDQPRGFVWSVMKFPSVRDGALERTTRDRSTMQRTLLSSNGSG